MLTTVFLILIHTSVFAFYMNFEEGLGRDRENIDNIPGVSFITSEGLNWIYSDILNGNYNARSIDKGLGSGSYQIYGYVGAWLGTTGNYGIIDFSDDSGTEFTVGVTSYSNFYLEAYDTSDSLIDTASLNQGNLNESDMAWLTVTGSGIDYVKMHDSGNYWITDEMSGDMVGGTAPIPEPTTMLLFSTGLFGLAFLCRKKYLRKTC